EAERELGRMWARGVAECIREALGPELSERALVGVAMPGLKTRDGRGIAVMKNGPRIPDFSDRVEEALEELGVALARPLPPIASDGACCGIGEQFGRCGSFSGVQDAYYVGSGTGLAEALKLGGRLLSLNDVSDWMLRAWQLRPGTQHGGAENYEDVLSASAMRRRYRESGGAWSATETPEAAAGRGDPIAIELLTETARALADLIFSRLCVVRGGKNTRLGFGETHRDRRGDHPYVGTLLERVVLGQRFARLYDTREIDPFFRGVLEARLVDRIGSHPDVELRLHMLEDGALRLGRIVASRQPGAPLLGAAGAAWRIAGRP
ncbi:MAG: hypothetical protein AAF368_12165, partial [Planctomycetota bacterium]